ATRTRTSRERSQLGGRTQEIQRLIGRSIRAMLDDFRFGEYTIKLDCDVVVADGGTRTAAITGACVAAVDAFDWLVSTGRIAATRSAGKLRELRPLFEARHIGALDLTEAGIEESPAEDMLEVFDTFEENALAKARYFHAVTGRPTVADDSGLAAVALGGEPGV